MTDIEMKIEGAKTTSNETDERVDRQVVLEQASQMDNIIPRPTDEAPFSRDLDSKKTHANALEESVEITKKPISNRKEAQLVQARQALKNKRDAQKREGKKGAQGTPAPDLITDITKYMDQKFDHIYKMMQDIPVTLPAQAPLQPQDDVKGYIEKVKDSVDPTLYHDGVRGTSKYDYPMHADTDHHLPIQRKRNRDMDYVEYQSKNIARRMKDAFGAKDIYNDDVRTRAMNPNQGGSGQKNVMF